MEIVRIHGENTGPRRGVMEVMAFKKSQQKREVHLLIAKGIAPVLPPQKGPSRPKEGGSPSPVNDWDFVPTYSGYGSFEPQNPPYFEL